MRITWLLLAKSADVGPRGLQMTDGDVDAIAADSIPGELKVDLVVHAAGLAAEFSEPHTYRVRLLDPDLEELASRDAPVPARARQHPAKPRHFPHELNIVTNATFFVAVPGWYRIEVTIDDDTRDVSFYVHEEVRLGSAAEVVVERLERQGAEVLVYPPGIYDDARGMRSKASCSVWLDPDLSDPVVGWGHTPDEAVLDAGAKVAALPGQTLPK